MIRIIGVLIFTVLFSAGALSQSPQPPIRWGEIPKSDLEMKTFAADSNASALVLCDYGESTINDNIEIVTRIHTRVKILDPKGFEKGTIRIRLNTSDNNETLSELEAVTWSLSENGSVLTQELQRSDIFRDKLSNDITEYRFTMPGLVPGCIIEYRYRITYSSIWLMPDWYFQGDEPVRWSEYRMKVPAAFNYIVVSRGYENFAINDVRYDASQVIEGELKNYLRQSIVPCNEYRFAVQNAPAIRQEPYSTTTFDYVNRIQVQLSGYVLPGGGIKTILNNWEKLVAELLDHKNLGKVIDNTRKIRKLAAQLTDGLSDPVQKMKAIYDWTARSVVYDRTNRVFSEKVVDDIIENKIGSNADITFTLISLLRCAGLQADPVLLSTRSNGKIQELHPVISQFNYLIASVDINGQRFFLDATDPLRPYDLLPEQVLNVKGLILNPSQFLWVTLTSPEKKYLSSAALLTIDDGGNVKGRMTDTCSGYTALEIRKKMNYRKEKEIVKEQFGLEEDGFIIDSVSVSGKDSLTQPLILSADISSSSYAAKNGEMIYINPFFVHRLKESPFKTKKRIYPIDYANLRETNTVTNIVIPEGYEILNKPGDRTISAAAEALVFSRKIETANNSINVFTKFIIKSIQIEPEYYHRVKDFYNRMAGLSGEQIVLTRKSSSSDESKKNNTEQHPGSDDR